MPLDEDDFPPWQRENWKPPKPPKAKPPVKESPRSKKRIPLEMAPSKEAEKEATDEKKPEVTRDVVVETVVIVFQGMATFVDESFNVLDDKFKPLPHVEMAVTEMMPWMEIYGGPLARMMPWIGLLAGLRILTGPAIGPVTEIIAGVRKPRIARKGPDDIYTDAYKAAIERRKMKEEAEKVRAVGRTGTEN